MAVALAEVDTYPRSITTLPTSRDGSRLAASLPTSDSTSPMAPDPATRRVRYSSMSDRLPAMASSMPPMYSDTVLPAVPAP